ncbi:Vitamin B12 import ATP-binding protein BtuD [Leucobacter aridicollis]|uniref:ABC-type multidrug transport system fused ATPase/permease subunit n=1 Tax=Leucobacter aridicollis TaxID=283878 RepID=A0A852QZQ9_9MICO|nr:ABC transporter ATP-binding protein [Leucobacter aridicollis]MCS3427235.1 ABC-type multidrug transport system fused ATPase/permease subunit [Leucobacter aridicollis]NYD27943.1 ABC-type multidrug transport system fused ATPase/permease subunit [Leucobacter aridicollis]
MRDLFKLYRRVLGTLPEQARRFLGFYASALGVLAVFDAAALGLLAAVIAPLSTGSPVVLPVLGELSTKGVVWAIVLICVLMMTKAIVSVILLRWATKGFAQYELQLGARLFRGYLRAPWEERLRKNSTDLTRLIDGSVAQTISGFLLPGATLIGEASSLIAVILVLAIAQPLVAVITLVYLGAIGMVLYFWIARHARIAGKVTLTYALKNSRLITEMVGALKEITLRGKSDEVSDFLSQNRTKTTQARANVQFLGQVPRFVLDAGIVGGFLIVGGASFLFGGASSALTAVALFGLAGFRMAPSVIRFQTIMSQMTSTSAHAKRVLEEIESAESAAIRSIPPQTAEFPNDPQSIEVRNMSFRYGGTDSNALSDISLKIPFGQTVAFVGESGSGKSTMVDILLGLLAPTEGDVLVDNSSIASLQGGWRSRLGYVPQEVSIFDASIAQNVALTWRNDYDEDKVRDSLDRAQLLGLVERREGGIFGAVGERGLSLSGGQKQRLGIARALYTDPKVLVMDEATSALDAETEAAITGAVNALKGDTTLILVAHRLSTVRNADQIFYLEQGRLVASGSFDDLVRKVKRFERQARLSGLID